MSILNVSFFAQFTSKYLHRTICTQLVLRHAAGEVRPDAEPLFCTGGSGSVWWLAGVGLELGLRQS